MKDFFLKSKISIGLFVVAYFLLLLYLPAFLLWEIAAGLSLINIVTLFFIGYFIFRILYILRKDFIFKYLYTIITFIRLGLFFNFHRPQISLKQTTIYNFLLLRRLLLNKNLKINREEILAIEKNDTYFDASVKVLVETLLFDKILRGKVIMAKNDIYRLPGLDLFLKIEPIIKENNVQVLSAVFEKDLLELFKNQAEKNELRLKAFIWLTVFESLYHNYAYSAFLVLNYERIASLLYKQKDLPKAMIRYINSRYYPLLRRKKDRFSG